MTTIVEMSVNMDCPGCERKIRKALSKLDGVNDIDIDMEMQKVTVTGWMEQRKVLKAAKRTGMRAELWPYPYNPEYHDFVQRYYPDQLEEIEEQVQNEAQRSYQMFSLPSSSSSYKYYYEQEQSYDGDGRRYGGYYQPRVYSGIIDEQASSLFSDDNPHACSIM